MPCHSELAQDREGAVKQLTSCYTFANQNWLKFACALVSVSVAGAVSECLSTGRRFRVTCPSVPGVVRVRLCRCDKYSHTPEPKIYASYDRGVNG